MAVHDVYLHVGGLRLDMESASEPFQQQNHCFRICIRL
jgi:hypothetical protein